MVYVGPIAPAQASKAAISRRGDALVVITCEKDLKSPPKGAKRGSTPLRKLGVYALCGVVFWRSLASKLIGVHWRVCDVGATAVCVCVCVCMCVCVCVCVVHSIASRTGGGDRVRNCAFVGGWSGGRRTLLQPGIRPGKCREPGASMANRQTRVMLD